MIANLVTNKTDLFVPEQLVGVWRSRPDLRASFDLNDPDDRFKYVGWCLWAFSIGHLDTTLVSEDFLKELQSPVSAGDGLTVEMYALWSFISDIREQYDLNTEAGRIGLLGWYLYCWADRTLIEHPEWQIDSLKAPPVSASASEKREPSVVLSLIGRSLLAYHDHLRSAYPLSAASDVQGVECWVKWFLSYKQIQSLRLTPSDLSDESLFDHWLAGIHQEPLFVQSCVIHKKRLLYTFKLLSPCLQDARSVLEIGGASLLAFFVRNRFPHVRVANTNSDLRYRLNEPDSEYDLVICTEVIEHLKDRDSIEISEVDRFNFSGVNSLFNEMYRVCRSGGKLILSTPNVNCLRSVYKAFCCEHPFGYEPHVREHSVRDVLGFIKRSGFEVESFCTLDVWSHEDEPNHQLVRKVLKENGFDTNDRGDCIFAVATKFIEE